MIKIKICGLKTIADIEIVNLYKPDYVGFVLAPSKRQISFEKAKEFKSHLDAGILTVGVFVNAEIETILKFVNHKIIDIIQLHGTEDNKYRAELRKRTACLIIQAILVTENKISETNIENTDFLLFDAASSSQRGGTGKTFDWSLLEDIKQPFFLAGGLNEHNISEAGNILSPYCFDVSSGMETNGNKDLEKIKKLIEIVRS